MRKDVQICGPATARFPARRRLDLLDSGVPAAWKTGVANVSIDGQFVARVDTATVVQDTFQAVLFSTTGLPAGTHTLTIDVVGRNNEAPGTTVQRVVVDAFDVY